MPFRPPQVCAKQKEEEAKPALPPKRFRSKTPSTPPLSPKLEEFTQESDDKTNSEKGDTNNELEKPCSSNNDNESKHQEEKEEVVLRRKSKVSS